jgi:cytochrome c oxidase subunit II
MLPPRTRRRWPLLLVSLGLLVLAGCGGNQNTVAPASHQEHRIANLFWVMLGGSTVGFLVVVFLLWLGYARRSRPGLPGELGDRGATRLLVGVGVALPIVLLVALFVWSDLFVIQSTAAPARGTTGLTVQVIGHEWWWEVRYPGSSAVTANEIHIPVDTRVLVSSTTADVIHSFWVPELNRKIDMIPGYTGRIVLDADRAGVFRGQCSEYCGLQHAHMAVTVVAEPKPAFRRWLAANSRPAASTSSAGEQVFMHSGCADCHQIRGTSAQGRVGPDLTHLELRSTLAAQTIPNTSRDLAEWIRDPQHVKPGSKMPDLRLTNSDWSALTAYLRTLR